MLFIHLCIANWCKVQLLVATFFTLSRRGFFTVRGAVEDFDAEGAEDSLHLTEPPLALLEVRRRAAARDEFAIVREDDETPAAQLAEAWDIGLLVDVPVDDGGRELELVAKPFRGFQPIRAHLHADHHKLHPPAKAAARPFLHLQSARLAAASAGVEHVDHCGHPWLLRDDVLESRRLLSHLERREGRDRPKGDVGCGHGQS
mmetsp:Transcript_913/g.1994  ORF Transcript_913/g.1994 Transcript_913/m.1994 type:complete len:202 (+) Transcript_913:1062-1667(+)